LRDVGKIPSKVETCNKEKIKRYCAINERSRVELGGRY
jgi:hypothetical protein